MSREDDLSEYPFEEQCFCEKALGGLSERIASSLTAMMQAFRMIAEHNSICPRAQREVVKSMVREACKNTGSTQWLDDLAAEIRADQLSRRRAP